MFFFMNNTPNPPNYTQIPNDLLGNILPGNDFEAGEMAKLTGAELKLYLAVCRITFGYHQSHRRASYANMVTLTGLTRQGIYKIIPSLEKRGLIEVTKDGGVLLWKATVNFFDNELCEADVNSVNVDVNSVDTDVNSVDIHLRKKPKKKPKKKVKAIGDKPPKSKPKKEVDPLKKPMMDALTRMCNIDYRTADKTQLGQIGTAANNLIKVVTHVENFERNFMQWWDMCDWRGLKGQSPKPNQVRQEFGNFEKWIKSGRQNGNHSQSSTTGTAERKRSTLDDKPTFNPHTGETVSGVRRSGISTTRPTSK